MKFASMDETRSKMREYETFVTVTVAGYTINLQDGDDVEVETNPCELCGSHTRVTVYRSVVDAFAGGRKSIKVFERET